MIKTKEFSQALASLLEGKNVHDTERILARAQSFLASRGLSRMFVPSLKEAVRILGRQSTGLGTVVLARESDGSKHRDHIAKDLADLGIVEYRTRIKEELVGGYIVETNNKKIDRSVKNRLVNLYQSLIAN